MGGRKEGRGVRNEGEVQDRKKQPLTTFALVVDAADFDEAMQHMTHCLLLMFWT